MLALPPGLMAAEAPYLGLLSFEEQHEQRYFGREKERYRILAQLAANAEALAKARVPAGC